MVLRTLRFVSPYEWKTSYAIFDGRRSILQTTAMILERAAFPRVQHDSNPLSVRLGRHVDRSIRLMELGRQANRHPGRNSGPSTTLRTHEFNELTNFCTVAQPYCATCGKTQRNNTRLRSVILLHSITRNTKYTSPKSLGSLRPGTASKVSQIGKWRCKISSNALPRDYL